jgi:hypothetical protein
MVPEEFQFFKVKVTSIQSTMDEIKTKLANNG